MGWFSSYKFVMNPGKFRALWVLLEPKDLSCPLYPLFIHSLLAMHAYLNH
jgi:hypothetical protein